MKRKIVFILLILFLAAGILHVISYNRKNENGNMLKNLKLSVKVPEEYSKIDKNKNGVPDPLDIVNGARGEVERETVYVSKYYIGGYPPEGEGVCTDVVWRGFKNANINLKELVDEDIRKHIKLYSAIKAKPDPNIDFRRVRNLDVFFRRHCEVLTKKLKAYDVENLKDWQPGDIIVFGNHIAVVSDKREKSGIPYVIHNVPPHAVEVPLSWFKSKIIGHYRWRYK